MKIILIGGGTLGSVSPLIAVWQRLGKKDAELQTLFVGTDAGPEKEFVARYQIAYRAISAGKLRRYFSWNTFLDFFRILFGCLQSFFILRKFRPDVIFSAGSYVAVPPVWLARFFKTKVVLYQPDLKIGLANKLCQKNADLIFTAFPETNSQFSGQAESVGAVLRAEIGLVKNNDSKTENILVLGGGTGSASINNLIHDSLAELAKRYRIIHITGKNKSGSFPQKENYQSFELLAEDYFARIADASLVISRAGLSTLMELSYLSKPVILVPLPESAQEENAKYFCRKQSAICLKQDQLNSAGLIAKVNQLMSDWEARKKLGEQINRILPHQGAEIIAEKIYELR